MITQSIAQANKFHQDRDYPKAISLYRMILEQVDLPPEFAGSIIFNIQLCEQRLNRARRVVGLSMVSDIDAAVADLGNDLSPQQLRSGLSALLRAKDAERFITGAVESVIDLVDEVIAVDNNSRDDTFQILQDLARRHPKLTVYQYNIDIPKVGADHEHAVNSGSLNTLGTYYNWCLSKVTCANVLKWDADFVCIQQNLRELINMYELATQDFEKAIWCTGITSYYGKVFNTSSYYDEFRIFSKKHGAKWTNWRGCETLTPSINKSPRLYIYPHYDNVKSAPEEKKRALKRFSKPVFVEIKDYLNLKPETMLLDRRDLTDNELIQRYKMVHADYRQPAILNTSSVLILLPNLRLGGGNYWAKFIYDQLRSLGVQATVGALSVTSAGDQQMKFHGIPREDIFDLSADPDPSRLNQFSHVLLTAPLPFPVSSLKCKLLCFTHSDISYFNNYIFDNFKTAVCLNGATVSKFAANGVDAKILRNFLPYEPIVSPCDTPIDESREDGLFNVLYCNRITEDKNVPMLIDAFAKLAKIDESARLTILAGASDDSPVEFILLAGMIARYNLSAKVKLLKNQANVAKFYKDADCVVLPSVSEGCSYGLLEAINFGVPVLSTAISANLEVTGGRVLHLDFDGLQKRIDEISSVPVGELYGALLEEIGYIRADRLYEFSTDGKLNYEFLSGYFFRLGVPFDKYRKNVKSFCPPLFTSTERSLLSHNSLAHEYVEHQLSLFTRNSDEVCRKLLAVRRGFTEAKRLALGLKEDLRVTYFDREAHLAQLGNVIFGDELTFVCEGAPK